MAAISATFSGESILKLASMGFRWAILGSSNIRANRWRPKAYVRSFDRITGVNGWCAGNRERNVE